MSAASTAVLPSRSASAVAAARRRIGPRRGDDLDQGHERNGVEEVHAHHPLRAGRGDRDLRHRQGRGVGGQDRGRGGRRVEAAKRVALEVQVLRDGLDHEPGGGQVGYRSRLGDPRQRGIGQAGVELALGHLALEEASDPVAGAVVGPGNRVQQRDVEPGLGRDLGNPRPHRPGTQDADPGDLGQ